METPLVAFYAAGLHEAARLREGHEELTAASAHLVGCGRATLTG